MGIMDKLFGEESTQKSSGTSTSTSEMDSLSKLLERVLSSSTGTTTKGGAREDASLSRLTEVLRTFMVDPIAAAKEQSRGAVDSTVSRILNQGIPGINTAQTMSGGYDSTTTKIMRDNLITQAAMAGAEVENKAVVDFANVQQSAFQNFLNAIQTGLEQSVVTKAEDETKREGEESTSSKAVEDVKQTGTVKGTATDSLVGGLSKAVAAFNTGG